MALEPVPAWYFFLTIFLISFFCAFSAIKLIRMIRDDSIGAIERFGHEMLNMCDEHDSDRIEEIDNLRIKIEDVEKKVFDLCQPRNQPSETLKTWPDEKEPSQL